MDVEDFFVFRNHDLNTRGHNFTLYLRDCRNDDIKNSFANRNIKCWNSLSGDIVNAKSVSSFKHGLNKCDLNDFIRGRALK